jgi:hypothetical protein
MCYCESGRVDNSLGNNDSDTIEKLRDDEVKRCAAKYEHYAANQRRIVNQTRTGTVSHHRLLHLLEK